MMLQKTLAGLFTGLFFLFSGLSLSHAQINEGGTPLSFTFEKSSALSEVIFMEMEYVDVEALKEEDQTLDFQPATPFRFGKNLSVNLNPQNSGTWDEIKGDSRMWRLGISSPGAKTLNFKFDQYNLPEGATLYIYSADQKEILGAFTHRNNQEDGLFATTLIRADEVIIEYFEPEGVAFPGELNLARVTHGYRGVGDYTKGFGDSGSCNLNVACDESEGWEDQIRSSAMLVSGGNGFCSGALINNADNDGTPYFLSANHCFSNPGSVVFWFNWQSETCANPSSSPSHDAMSGAVTRARHNTSDFWLMELNDTPPDDYNVFYSGWNRTTEDEVEGLIVGIHHPSADIKKFSYTDGGVQATGYLGAPGSGTSHWRVLTWDDGTTTEPGSSGSPIYDADGRILGQLHGGYAACGNTLEDWYGRIGVSFTGGGASSSRLSDWLDPGDSGVMAIDGFDPNVGVLDHDAQLSAINEPRGSYDYGTVVTPEVTIRNAGIQDLTSATVSYNIENGPSQSIDWTGTLETADTEVITFNSINLPEGNYTITAMIDAPNDENPDNNVRSRDFRVIDCTSPPRLPFTEDFEISTGVPDCWEVVDHQGNGQVWQFGTHGNGLPGSFGRYAYIDSDAYGSGNSQNTDLVTPSLDLSVYEDVNLSFSHYFRQYQSTSVASVHYSIDDGETWVELQNWTADTPNPTSFDLDIPEVDGQSAVKFKWKYVGNWSWYWSVGDIEVTGTQTEPFPAYAEFFHNMADDALEEVDLYLDDELVISGLGYLSTSNSVALTSEQEVTLSIRAAGSNETVGESVFTFEEDGDYDFVLQGVSDPGGFSPNPDGHNIGADFLMIDDLEVSSPGQNEVGLLLYNGVTDSPSMDVWITDGAALSTGLHYGSIQSADMHIAADTWFIEFRDAGSGEVHYVFELDVNDFGGTFNALVATGFMSPGSGSGFKVFMVTEDDEMIELRNATSAGGEQDQLPVEYELSQNYPNPFNPTTNIQYALPEQEHVRLDVYNITGQRVATLVNGTQTAGYHTVSFDASRLASGVYVYRIQAGNFTKTQKMMLVK